MSSPPPRGKRNRSENLLRHQVQPSHTGRRLCRSGGNEFLLITDGMGPKAARAKALQALAMTPPSNDPKQAANHTPDAVLVLGLCGSLSASLPETRVVVYTGCLSTKARKPSLRCAQSITNRLIDLLVSGKIPCDPVTGITSARIAVTIEEKVALARSGAKVVDMESYEILDVAAQAGIPGAVLRVVSDSLEREMPDFDRALGQDGAVDRWKVFTLMLGSPLQTARLLGVNKRAMQRLTKALEVILPSDCLARDHSPMDK